jgi:hypothetical protein
MPSLTITVSQEVANIAQALANKSGTTVKDLVELILTNWGKGQIDGYYIAKLNDLTLQEKINLLGDIQ